jgi:DNA invertase Pin-like site-specific DNA recombinase
MHQPKDNSVRLCICGWPQAVKADVSAINRQREACQRIAARHGLTIIREYADIGRAARLDQQVELLRLLGDLHQWRDVAFVVVWDYARFARSMEQLNQVMHHIYSCGAAVTTVSGVEVVERFVQERIVGQEREEVNYDK